MLWDRPQVIYHCLACDRCYGVPDGRATAPALSDAECNVLRLTMAGWPNKQIARQMGISLRTVALRRRGISTKLGAKNRTELVRNAIALGLG